jgi:DNA-binding transcriptional LysR family regulator
MTASSSSICAAAGVRPDIAHKVDSLELILEFVAADLGMALVPASVPARGGVRLVPMSTDGPLRRTYAATRPGRENWPPSALLTQRVGARVACDRLTSGADHAPTGDGQAAADNPEGNSSA